MDKTPTEDDPGKLKYCIADSKFKKTQDLSKATEVLVEDLSEHNLFRHNKHFTLYPKMPEKVEEEASKSESEEEEVKETKEKGEKAKKAKKVKKKKKKKEPSAAKKIEDFLRKEKVYNNSIREISSIALSSNGNMAFFVGLGNSKLFCFNLKTQKLKCKFLNYNNPRFKLIFS
jgi:uncharacterized protein with von Willebrand factor type A (vWA) domain